MSEVTLIRNPESPVVVIQPTTTTITAPDNMDAAETATQAALEANLARNDAQASATAADADRIAAETARTTAQAAAAEATAQATAADASADAAAVSASAAASSATQASSSQSAAAASATTASTKAAEADTARIASEAAQVAAAASEDAADASADAAQASALAAAGSASTATSAKDAAITAKTAAEAAEAAADTSADAAFNSATAAASSATAAANSATAASNSEDATAADRTATGLDRTAAAASASAAAASETAAATSASASAASATASQTSRLASEDARDSSISAKTASEAARDAAQTAKTAAELAETNAETAETAAEAAQALAEAARDAAQASAGQASASKDAAALSASAAATSASDADADRVAAQTARTGSEAARDAALAAQTAAETARTAAQTAQTGAQTARTGAEVAQTGAQSARAGAEAAQAAALVSQNAANTSAGLASGSAASALAIYGSVTAQQAAVATAQAQASLAAGHAASAASVVQQDLSGITAQALHRSPNAITAMAIYDTSKDSDGGAWTEKCQHTSWWNEPLSGKWLGAQASELYARSVGATLSAELTTGSNWAGEQTLSSAIAANLGVWNVTPTVGKLYAVTLNVTSYTSGSIWVQDTSTTFISASSVGSQTAYRTASTAQFKFYTVGGFVGKVIVSVREVTAINTVSNDYFQLTTDGKFYRLWKNLLANTEALSIANGWSFNGTPQFEYGFLAPDGTNTAWKITFPTGSGGTQVGRLFTEVFNLPVTVSAWMRSDTPLNANFGFYDGGNDTSVVGLTTTWAQFSRTRTAGLIADRRVCWFYPATGDANQVIYFWHPQLEVGTSVTAYEAKAAVTSRSEVFRGNKTDFPRLAAIVAEAGNVNIYDLTEPGRPMWMRLLAGTAAYAVYGNVSTVAALNGIVAAGSNGGYNPVDFAKDSSDIVRLAGQGLERKYTQIALRHAPDGNLFSSTTKTQSIANNTVNAIAMTVLPDAPVDPATGLRVPTIAVATGGGMSIIKHNGTSVNSAFTGAMGSIALDKNYVIASRNDSAAKYGAFNPNALANSFAISMQFNGGAPDAVSTTAGKLVRKQREEFLINNSSFVSLLKNHETTFTRGLGNRIANTFNTGWLPGDVRRCFLSETDLGSSVGGELVVNGTFDTVSAGQTGYDNGNGTVQGWTGTAGGGSVPSLSIVGSALRITPIAGATGAYYRSRAVYQLTTVAGRTYRLSFVARSLTGGANSTIYYGLSTTPPTDIEYAYLGGGLAAPTTFTSYSAVYRATSSVTYIQLAAYNNAGEWLEFDNVSVTEIAADRSYRGAAALPYGTITRSQLTTGTSLVGYSGFSASNYLREPYSADLDFGTGEWSCSAWVNVPVSLPNGAFSASDGVERVTSQVASAYGSGTVTNVGGVATATSTGSTFGLVYPSSAKPAGRYKVTIEVVEAVGSGNLVVHAGDANVGTTIGTTPGVITLYIDNYVSGFDMVVRANASAGAYFSIKNVSFFELGPSLIVDRAFSSGPRLRLGVNGAGRLIAAAFDGTTTRTVTTTAAYNTASWLKAEACYTTDGTLSIRVNGREVATSRGNPLLSLSSGYNLQTYSEDFSRSVWNRNGGATAVLAASVSDPNGNTGSVYQFVEGSAANSRYLIYSIHTVTSGVAYRFSAYLKANTRRYAGLSLTMGGRYGVIVDLETGTLIEANSVSSPTNPSYSIESAGNGWWRVSVQFTASSTSANPHFMINDDATPTWSGFADTQYTGDGTSSVYIWGADFRLAALSALPYQRTTTVAETQVAPLTIGNNFATDAPFPGSIALLKLSATVPTYEQSQFMYEQEKQLFRTGAQSVLPDSGSIVDMAYDDATDRWVAVSASNESYWTGLVRNSVTPVPAGSYTRVVAGSGLELVARSTTNPGVDVTIPAYGLREELVKRAEAAARLTKEIVTYDYVGGFTANTTNGNTAITNVSTITYPASYIGARISGSGIPANTTIVAVSGTTIYLSAAATATATGVSISFLDFALPVGMEARTVFNAGVQQREGATAAFTRLYDGFVETIRFGVAPGVTALVSIQAQRITMQ